jgi:septum formation protein
MEYKYLKALAVRRPIVLGSGSPRRVMLLEETGIEFRQVIPQLAEVQLPGEPPYDYAVRLAEDKARWVAGRVEDDKLVIGCDTIVVLQDRVCEKPGDEREALDTLSLLSGKEHVVCTALAIASAGEVVASGYELTCVFFNEVTTERIEQYIATGEPLDKAGAYGIQGMGAFLVDRIEGNLDNVIGLPKCLLDRMAKEVIDNHEVWRHH